jgi:leader peptidase (prepilin peptidase) / N-methyltransferase
MATEATELALRADDYHARGTLPSSDVTIADLAAACSVIPAWLVGVFAVTWGCVWGSFVNVVIHRVPRELSIVRPGSHCPACSAPVRAIDNIPVLSWLLLRGRARCCGARISPRYPVVELLGGLLALAVLELVVRPGADDATVVQSASIFFADFALAMALLAAAFIDAEHMYLPDVLTLGGTVFGIATPGLRGMTWFDALFGASVGFLGVWLPFIVGYKALRGRVGMGLGDAKLVMLSGAWFGWPGVVFAVFAGATQASVGALILLLARGKIEEPESVRKDREELERAAAGGDEDAKRAIEEDPLATAPAEGIMAARLPFGPFLCLAIVEWMLAGTWIRERFLPF